MNTTATDAATAAPDVRRRGGRLAVVTAVAGTVFIAAGAFWLSFTALADLARRAGVGAGQAWAWPLIVDGLIVVGTVAVVALAGQRSAWYPWLLLICGATVSVTANALHAIVAAATDVPDLLAASVAAVPPLVLLAITHLTVILTRPATPPPVTEVATAEPRPDEIALADAPSVAAPPSTPPRLEPVFATDEPDGRQDGSHAREAADVLHEQGWSNKRIAQHLGVHKTTVGRWFPQPTPTPRQNQVAPHALTKDATEVAP
jgi:hypothetical protein